MSIIVVGIVYGHRIVHAWVEQVVQVARLFIGSEVWEEEFVKDGERVGKMAAEAIDSVPGAQFTASPLTLDLT